ncbi:hydroxyquinol 1,2-dioxygenase [Pseudomonas alliivorans]|nr:hydroxyquinol 1,2-dioxygenase [Pseudomonas alliivorans]MEE5145465.1 hydroxyquinol 1,2-dioxygenase [Pseudomonas alliivorans]
MGLSTLVTAQNNKKPDSCTEATVFGPFYVDGAPAAELGTNISNGMVGASFFVSGVVRGLKGELVPNARIEVWHADESGFYDVQAAVLNEYQGHAVMHADGEGRYHFESVLPECYPIPDDGSVGQMFTALNRHPWRPAHLHFMITAPGYERLVTHIFKDGSDYLDSDAVFGVRSTLISEWVNCSDPLSPYGQLMNEPFYKVDCDFVLNPQSAKAGKH